MLNRAHWLHRQAEKATRKGRVEEAIKYHKEATDILNQLLQNILDEKAKESVRLQAQLHEKERHILKQQRKRAEQVYRDLESLRKMTANQPASTDGDSLQISIYRKFEETECLLDQLRIHDDSTIDDAASLSSSASVRPPLSERSFTAVPINGNNQQAKLASAAAASAAGNVVVGTASKKPKDEKVIIEELQVANSHLRKMVDSLFFELSSAQRENLELKARLRYYEGIHCKPIAIQTQGPTRPLLLQSVSAQPSPMHGFKTFKPDLTPVRGSKRTQMAFKDDDTSLQSSSTINEECDLPPLPPLDLPNFVYDKRPEA